MTKKKKIALATLPMLALIVLGSSVASVYAAPFEGLTEEQRSALLEARELRKEGDAEGARDILKNAGIPLGKFHSRGKDMQGKGMSNTDREQMHVRHEALRDAVEKNDFDAFKAATLDAPFADMVTPANFAKLVEAHELREAGDKDAARKILEDIGFPRPMHGGGMMHGKGSDK